MLTIKCGDGAGIPSFFFSSRRRHTRSLRDWSSDACSSDLDLEGCTELEALPEGFRVGSLVLRGCSALVRLPEGLEVNFLDLRGCAALSEWPSALRVRIRSEERRVGKECRSRGRGGG